MPASQDVRPGSDDSFTLPAIDPGTSTVDPLEFAERYVSHRALAAGGMGQILAAQDHQIGREIALKRMLPNKGDRARFVREARIQGQLEHPAIVPVYDLGIDPDGEAWFTMKQVRGVTLATIMSGLRERDPAVLARFSRRRLLTAFTNVCLAIDFAHARGVVHRDLKPANIMLGDFGEVYVLDWGIARLHGTADPGGDAAGSEREDHADPPRTMLGQVVGTLGYMPPEQLVGDIDRIGPRSDVWALGAILFELLALERLMPRWSLAEAIANVDEPFDARPSARTPREPVPPELDAICVRALAHDPRERWPSARALNDEVERYLDGDRDIQRRRELAVEHLARAEAEAALIANDGPDAIEARRRAMQEVSRAVALDPSQHDATHTMLRLLLTPPRQLPDEAREELRATEREAIRVAGRVGGWGILAMYLFLPVYLWMGIRDWATTGLAIVTIAASALFAFLQVRWPQHARAYMLGLSVSLCALLLVLTRVASPFALAPTIAVALGVALTLHPTNPRSLTIVALVTTPLITAVVLELTGVLAPSFEFGEHGLTLLTRMIDLQPTKTTVMLTAATLGTVTGLALYLASLRDTLRAVQEQLHLHTWNLRQLVPTRISSEIRRTPAPR